MKTITTTFRTYSQFTDGDGHQSDLDVVSEKPIQLEEATEVLHNIAKESRPKLINRYNKKGIDFQIFSHQEWGHTVLIVNHPRNWNKQSQENWDDYAQGSVEHTVNPVPDYKTLLKGSQHIA